MSAMDLLFGRQGDSILHISQVERGLGCNCVCAACGGRLIARKGTVRAHHFAHQRSTSCARAVETALHLAAKAILTQRREITLPAVHIEFNSYRAPLLVAPERTITFDEIRSEHRTEDVIPDLLAFVGQTPLMIEVRVTHAVDESKLRKILALGISAVEIDLSEACRVFLSNELTDAIVHRTANKRWLFNARAEKLKRELFQTGERKPTVRRGQALHVQGCPIDARLWRGRSYANVIDDCTNCPYTLEIGHNLESVLCGGRHRSRGLTSSAPT